MRFRNTAPNVAEMGKTVRLIFDKPTLNLEVNTHRCRKVRAGKPLYKLLDAAVLDYLKESRGKGIAVNGQKLRRKAKSLFPQLYHDYEHGRFVASTGWLKRFMKRNEFTVRQATSVDQKIPVNAPELCDQFLSDMPGLQN